MARATRLLWSESCQVLCFAYTKGLPLKHGFRLFLPTKANLFCAGFGKLLHGIGGASQELSARYVFPNSVLRRSVESGHLYIQADNP